MRKYCITADTEVAYDIHDGLMIVGKSKIKKENCKDIVLDNDKIILKVENSKSNKTHKRLKC